MKRKNEHISVEELEGEYTALITPMFEGDGLDNPIDYDTLFMLIDNQIAAKATGLVPAGTTGQDCGISEKEQVELAKKTFDYVNGRVPIIVGAGSNRTQTAIDLSLAIEDAIGPTTFLHATGYKNNPPQAGQLKHYTKIADAIQGNILLYNIPGRTCSEIEPATAIELARHPKIIGEKEASGKLANIKEVIDNTDPDTFRVLSGNCGQVSEIIKMGGYGTISATANVAPRLFVELTEAALNGYHEKAAKIQERASELVHKLFSIVKSPIPLAYIFNTHVRLPLCSLEEANPKAPKIIDDVLAKYNTEELGIDISKYR